MNSNPHIQELFRKYIAHSIDREEYGELLRYLGSGMDDEAMHDYIVHALRNDERKVDPDALAMAIAKVDSSLQKRIFSEKPNVSWIKRFYPYVAAAAVLIVSVFSYVYITERQQDPTRAVQFGMDVDPGTNKATLTLADGRIVDLSASHEGIILTDEGVRYTNGDSVVGDMEGSLTSHVSQLMAINTPRGGQYQITLPDGTKVFVNSASTLQYPSIFGGTSREVEIQGEAYFQVAHDNQKPFIVKSGKQAIHVLGTQFNVSNYVGEPLATTLLKGSVQIRFGASAPPLTLIPGQQAVVEDGLPTIHQVDAEDYVAWTRDLFVFNDASLREIMKQLERWYDIEVAFPEGFREERFFAEIPRDRKLSEVLRQLERSGNFKFEQKGRRVVVQQ